MNIIKNTIKKNLKDDDEEEDDIQITLTTNRFGKRATRYLLQIPVRLVSVIEGGSLYFMCRLEAGHIMSICSGKNRPTRN